MTTIENDKGIDLKSVGVSEEVSTDLDLESSIKVDSRTQSKKAQKHKKHKHKKHHRHHGKRKHGKKNKSPAITKAEKNLSITPSKSALKKEGTRLTLTKSIRGTFGMLPKGEQQEHDKIWRNFSTFRRKSRPLLENQNTMALHFNAEDVEQPNNQIGADYNDGWKPPEFVSSDYEDGIDLEEKEPKGKKNIKNTHKSMRKLRTHQQPALYEEPEKGHKPIFIWLITLVDIVMMVYAIVKNHGFEQFQVNPWGGPSQQVLIDLGAKDAPKIRDGQWWRFITPLFLHVGVIHLLLNLTFQWKGGSQIEESVGTIRTFLIYFISGIGGNLLSAVFLPNLIQVGASGALFGLFAILFGDLFQNWKEIYEPKSTLLKMILAVLITLGAGLLPAVDNFAHVGGFIVGLLSGAIIMPYITFGTTRKILLLICIPLLGAYFAILFIFFYRDIDGNSWCSFCKYITCIPVKDWCDNIGPEKHTKTDIQ
ncbi:rhomboid-like protein [Anaeramoeba ignava]|uniref:rhomboid protease n=1 Tax=Anaeramoeba ignava TaxID=1746090 RepID=A0A9Q0LRC2_ANAIG|nr:rhomboid-like protein [Anaeramoeba ignava]